MEVPNLGVSSIWCLDDHISIVDKVKIPVFFHLRNNMEVFLNNESEFFIHLSLLWFWFPLIDIDDVPLLVKTIVSSINSDVSVFLINITSYFHNLSSLVDDVVVLESEHLPPSCVGGSASEVI